MNTGFGGSGGLVDLQTTIAGFEVTLETLVEISNLLKRLDERLAQLSPELPQISTAANGGQSLSTGFAAMLTAYQDAFAAMAAAARSAALLGLGDKPVVLNIESTLQAQAQAAPAPVAQPAAAPVVESVPTPIAQAAPVVEVQAAPVAPAAPAAAEEPTPQVAAAPKAKTPVPAGDLKPVGAIASQRYGTAAPGGKQIKADAEVIKPLKPIDMPSAENQVGPMISVGMGVVYAHGNELKKHWPGARDAKANLEAPIPNDSWRLLNFDGNVFCASEDKVMVFGGAELHKEGNFPAKLVAQTHTLTSWAGLQVDGDSAFVTFRDKSGKNAGDTVAIQNPGDANVFLASSGEAVYVAFSTGELFRVEGSGVQNLPKLDKNGSIFGFAVDPRGLYVTSQGGRGVIVSMLDKDGNVVRESKSLADTISHVPAFADHTLHLFDDCKSEMVTVDLDSLQATYRTPLEGVTGITRLIALQEDSVTTLAILACDSELRPTDALLHTVETERTAKLCHLTLTKGDLVYADGHIGVSSTSSLQNMIQVFSVYGPMSGVKAA
jgi:hypothetical protein